MKAQPRKKLSLAKMIPNMITLAAMAAGMTAIKFAIASKWEEAVIAIVIAAFMDAFDGAAARLLKAQSKLGAELDSLSDFACFGVAPAIVLYLWSAHDAGRWGWIFALIFTTAAALRLARFNIVKEEDVEETPLSKYFTGVPAPVGAGLALLPMIVTFQFDQGVDDLALEYVHNPGLVCVWLLIIAGMMVSHIPTFSSKQIRVPHKMGILVLSLFAIMVAGLINATWPTLTLMGFCYLLMLPFSVQHYNRKAASLAQGLRDPDDTDGDD